MKNWTIQPLGKLILPTEQRDPRLKPEEDFIYVDIAGVDNETKTIATTKRLVGVDAPSRAKKVIRNGDVIVSTVRPNLNAVALVPSALDNQICSTGFSVLRPSEKVLSGYLFAFARSPSFIDHLVARTTGANYPAVNDGEVRDVPIPVPSLAEQEQIVKLLDEADELRKLRAQADRRADALIPALFHEMFGSFAEPKYAKKRLGDLIKLKSGEFLPSKSMAAIGTHPVYGGNGISGYHDAYLFNERKVVIGRVGYYCGAVHFTEPQSWITDNALYVVEQDPFIVDEYLVEALRILDLKQYAGQAAQPLVSGGRIYPLEIPFPPREVQAAFAERVNEIREIEATHANSRTRLEALFQSMLHRAFNGEL